MLSDFQLLDFGFQRRDPFKLFAPSRHPASSFIGTKPTFNPHSSTRPPQPPAASF
jgi:hypothetical protein